NEIIRHMVGREIKDFFPRRRCEPGAVLLRVQELSVSASPRLKPFLNGISFEARSGEVLGLGGLMGSGRSELLMHIFGAWGHRAAGNIEFAGRSLARLTPREAIGRGLVLVTEDRKRFGLILDQNIGFNLS